MRKIALLVLFIASGIFYYYLTLPKIEVITSKVTDVVDGDTVHLENGLKIRFLGINTPERNQPLYKDAKDFLINLILNKTVSVKITGKDRYNRSLGYVFLNDKNVNQMIVETGLATTYFYDKDKYYKDFIASEDFARSNNKGLWNKSEDSTCISIIEFQYIEKNKRCNNEEVLSLKNSCDKTIEFSIKDDATHIFNYKMAPLSILKENFSCIFNDEGDSLYIYDSKGLLTFYRYG